MQPVQAKAVEAMVGACQADRGLVAAGSWPLVPFVQSGRDDLSRLLWFPGAFALSSWILGTAMMAACCLRFGTFAKKKCVEPGTGSGDAIQPARERKAVRNKVSQSQVSYHRKLSKPEFRVVPSGF